MKIINIFAAFSTCACILAETPHSPMPPPPIRLHTAVITPLDRALFSSDTHGGHMDAGPVRRHMEKHSLDAGRMLDILDANIQEHMLKINDGEGEFVRIQAAQQTLGAMRFAGDAAAGTRIMVYADEQYPEDLRVFAVSRYLAVAKLGGLPFASNVISQTWRSFSEHNALRVEYYAQAKSAAPEEREKYVEFFKWAVGENYIGGAIDENLLEL